MDRILFLYVHTFLIGTFALITSISAEGVFKGIGEGPTKILAQRQAATKALESTHGTEAGSHDSTC